MQDISIPGNKRISYFFGWDPVTRKPKHTRHIFGVWNFFWTAYQVILQGISWAMRPVVGHGLRIGQDLDLLCYVFDKNNQLIETIAPGVFKDINESGSIYHSGDDEDGRNGPFDEELSLELAKIPSHAETILLYIRNDSGHEPEPRHNAKIRLMNMTDHQELFLYGIPFDQDREHGYIAGRLVRDGENWKHQFIDEYSFKHPDRHEAQFFGKYLGDINRNTL